MKAQTVPDTRGLVPAIPIVFAGNRDPRDKPWDKPAGNRGE